MRKQETCSRRLCVTSETIQCQPRMCSNQEPRSAQQLIDEHSSLWWRLGDVFAFDFSHQREYSPNGFSICSTASHLAHARLLYRPILMKCLQNWELLWAWPFNTWSQPACSKRTKFGEGWGWGYIIWLGIWERTLFLSFHHLHPDETTLTLPG